MKLSPDPTNLTLLATSDRTVQPLEITPMIVVIPVPTSFYIVIGSQTLAEYYIICISVLVSYVVEFPSMGLCLCAALLFHKESYISAHFGYFLHTKQH